jgi:hypothetical protein
VACTLLNALHDVNIACLRVSLKLRTPFCPQNSDLAHKSCAARAPAPPDPAPHSGHGAPARHGGRARWKIICYSTQARLKAMHVPTRTSWHVSSAHLVTELHVTIEKSRTPRHASRPWVMMMMMMYSPAKHITHDPPSRSRRAAAAGDGPSGRCSRAGKRPTHSARREPSHGPAVGARREHLLLGLLLYEQVLVDTVHKPTVRTIDRPQLYESARQARPAKQAAESRQQQRRRSTPTKVLGQWDG